MITQLRDNGDAPLSEAELRDAIQTAAVPALLMVVFQITGDEKWLGKRYRPTRGRGLNNHESGGLPDEVQAEIRDAAVDAILYLQAGNEPAVAELSPERTVELVSLFLGEKVDDRYGPLLAGELRRRSATGADLKETQPIDAPDGYKVVVIGLGVAGLVAIHYLQEMGIDFTVFERAKEAGGVWYQNTYPGAGVDTPSHLYSFSFIDRDWKKHFELRDELHSYFTDVLDQLHAADQVQFESEVLSATYSDETSLWTVEVRGPDGFVAEYIANIVISAVGSLNKPRLPDIRGMDTFTGTQFHSSNWPEGFDVRGKRVAIVGVGASSQQIAPEIAPLAEHITIFQRSPQWVAPFDLFREDIAGEERTLLQHVRLYHAWSWVRLFWQFGDKVINALRIDPGWEHPERSVNAVNDGHRKLFTRYLQEQLAGRPDLYEKALPDFPPFGKRILLDNGWYSTLKRDNVTLLTEGVTSVDASGLVDSAGEHIDVDVIIWATGFHAAYFLDSLEVRGVEGVHLREVWEGDDPKAYLGVSIPNFPNFFMLGGPHSFPGSGSFMYFMEVQMRYLRDLITGMLEQGITAIDAREDVTARYNEVVDDLHAKTVWTHPGFGTYYRNSKGRVIFVMPFLNLEYWEFTQRPDFENYTLRVNESAALLQQPA
ncbi:flavin-containing monooxygenase [Cryobacterium aureum]|uniref:flavin-containing monooxygenase n=1 Tax=Cryobacterium aureum TaxID=995037 RepID=UPI000CF3E82E|nr:NAD(P)/FAD-dependent oxidoreductase [Cryobacterium aureum]